MRIPFITRIQELEAQNAALQHKLDTLEGKRESLDVEVRRLGKAMNSLLLWIKTTHRVDAPNVGSIRDLLQHR